MRVKVVRTYVDKYTHFRHIKDTEETMTKERFEEIALTGPYVEEIKAVKKTAKK